MKIHRNLFYVCLTGIMIFYIMNLIDSMYLSDFRFGGIVLWGCLITNVIFIINLLFESDVRMKELLVRLLVLIVFILITIYLKNYMTIYSTILSVYLFDLGFLLAKIICEKIHINQTIRKYLFIAVPLGLVFRLPTYINGENVMLVSSDGYMYARIFDTYLQWFLNFLLAVYLGTIIILSDRTSTFNLIASIIYLVILLIWPKVIATHGLNDSNLVMNSFAFLISYILIYFYNRRQNKVNIV